MALRMLRVAGGGSAATAETQRMLSEKLTAACLLQRRSWLLGLLGHTAPEITGGSLRHYRKLVRANRRRLERRPKTR